MIAHLETTATATAVAAALVRIPPLWPLKHFVAVNPFSGITHLSFTEACQLLERTMGAAPLQSPADYLNAYQNEEISAADLAAAATADWTPECLSEMLQKNLHSAPIKCIATVADLLDSERPRAHWSVFIIEEISKWCAVTYDENQTTWRSPWQKESLYTAWKSGAIHDRNPEAFGLVGFRKFITKLPANSSACSANANREAGSSNVARFTCLLPLILSATLTRDFVAYT